MKIVNNTGEAIFFGDAHTTTIHRMGLPIAAGAARVVTDELYKSKSIQIASLSGIITISDFSTAPWSTVTQDELNDVASITGNAPTLDDKDITASITTSDGDLAFAGSITHTPAVNSFVSVTVNNVGVTIGDGVKVGVGVYFSNDSGATALNIADIASGSTVHWNGSVSGYELDSVDRMSLFYNV